MPLSGRQTQETEPEGHGGKIYLPDQGIGFLKKSVQVPSANSAAMRCRGDAKEAKND